MRHGDDVLVLATYKVETINPDDDFQGFHSSGETPAGIPVEQAEE